MNRYTQFLSFYIIIISVVTLVSWDLAHAQRTNTIPDSVLKAILADLEGTPLTLSMAIENGLENSTSVRKSEAEYLVARATVRRERGVFDPLFFFNLLHEDDQQPAASFFSGAPVVKTEQTTAATGLRVFLPFGTELEASLNSVTLRSNSAFAFLNPQYTVFSQLRLRQPLLGGFHLSARKELSSAEETLNAAEKRFEQAKLFNASEVEIVYWDLYAAERDFAVQQMTRDQAALFLKETELRALAGLIGSGQVANARTFLAEQELLLIDRSENLDRYSDNLASLIGIRPSEGVQRFRTVDDPPVDMPVDAVDDLLAHAMQENLDLIAAGKDTEVAMVRARAAGWEALPQIDLIGALGGNGLSGSARDVIFGGDTLVSTRNGSWNDAANQSVQRDFPSWSIGVEVSIPIGFRNGLGERDRLEAEVLRAEQTYIETTRQIEQEIRTNHRVLIHAQRRTSAAHEGVIAAQEQVRIGRIEFYNGRSTAFELVRLDADLAIALQRYYRALVQTAKAAARMRQLTSAGAGNRKEIR
jgi:outer membrane protein TolC